MLFRSFNLRKRYGRIGKVLQNFSHGNNVEGLILEGKFGVQVNLCRLNIVLFSCICQCVTINIATRNLIPLQKMTGKGSVATTEVEKGFPRSNPAGVNFRAFFFKVTLLMSLSRFMMTLVIPFEYARLTVLGFLLIVVW